MQDPPLAEAPLAYERLRCHPAVLNLHFLEPSVRRGVNERSKAYLDTAEFAFERVRTSPRRRLRDLARRVGSVNPASKLSTEELDEVVANLPNEWRADAGRGYYTPLTYGVWGEHDLLLIYATESLTIPPPSVTETHDLIDVRQSLFQCHLLHIEGESRTNLDYLEALEKLGSTPTFAFDSVKPAHFRFASVIRVKVAAFATWSWEAPASAKEAWQEPRLREAVRSVHAVLRDWLDARPEERIGAIGISLCWTEIVVTAHAIDVDQLFELVLKIRRLDCEVNAPETVGDDLTAHLALATRTEIGFDFAIEKRAVSRTAGRRGKVRDIRQKSIRALYRLARCIAERVAEDTNEQHGSYGRPAESKPRRTTGHLVIRFSALPGHEHAFMKTAEALGRGTGTRIEVGPLEFTLPSIKLHQLGSRPKRASSAQRRGLLPKSIDAVEAAALTCLLRSLLAAQYDDGSVRNYYGSLSTVSGIVDDSLVDAVKDTHCRDDPRAIFVHRSLEGNRWSWPTANELRGDLRTLQVPFSQTEQVLSTFSAVHWLWDSYIHWEPCLELVPALLEFAEFLSRGAAAVRDRRIGASDNNPDDTLARTQEEVELFLVALRSILSAPHWTVSTFGQRIDLNLKRRGAVEQVHSIAGMMVYAAVDLLIGQVACVTVVGEKVMASVTLGGDVLIFDVPLAVLETPILFDQIPSMVATRLIGHLVHRPPRSEWSRTTGAARDEVDRRLDSWRRLGEHLERLGTIAFAGPANDDSLFMAAVIEFIGRRMLGLDENAWVRSFLLRVALLDDEKTYDEHFKAPVRSPEAAVNAIRRVGHLKATEAALRVFRDRERLTQTSQDVRPDLAFFDGVHNAVDDSLERLREFLADTCIVFPGPDKANRTLILDKDEWSTWVEENVLGAIPWLRSPRAMDAGLAFFAGLDDYVRERIVLPRQGLDMPRVGGLWPTIASHLGTMRAASMHATRRVRISVSDHGEEPAELDMGQSSGFELPLHLSDEQLEPERAEVLLCPRGRLLFARYDELLAVSRSNSEFSVAMIELLPEYRRRLGWMIYPSAKAGGAEAAAEDGVQSA